MTALYVILGIIAFFIILLSIRLCVTVHYEDDVELSVKWLFLNIKILPKKEKKEKKKKDAKPKKEKKPQQESEIIKEPKKKKQDNMFVRFYRNRGVEGVVQLLKDAAKAIGGMFKRIGRAFLFEELIISLTVGAGDSAETAINLLTPLPKRCSHLGCALKYNKHEHSWDCPCHGSRFDEKGEVIENPATKNIKLN